MTVRETRSNRLGALLAAFRTTGIKITVGIHGEEGRARHPGGPTVAEIGSFHEFGTTTTPQRSFVRGWFDESQREIATVLKGRLEAVAKGADMRQQLSAAALAFEASMKERISNRIPPPLSQTTIARKGSSVPLIDTGALLGSIRARVR